MHCHLGTLFKMEWPRYLLWNNRSQILSLSTTLLNKTWETISHSTALNKILKTKLTYSGNSKLFATQDYCNRKFRKMFPSPIRELNPQSSDLRWEALTIELTGLRWQRECYDVYCFVCATYVFTVNAADLISLYVLLLNYKASHLAGPHQLNSLSNREWISYTVEPCYNEPPGIMNPPV